MHQGTSQKITSLSKSLTAITTDILIWCHFFLPLILATYNDYITLCYHFMISFGFILLLFGLIFLFFIYLMGKYRLISVNAHTRLSVILREYSLKTLVPLVFVFINVLEEDSMNFN